MQHNLWKDAIKRPLKVAINHELLDTIDPSHQAVVKQLANIMESEIFTYDYFPISLPQSKFLRGSQSKEVINLSDLFKPPSFDELQFLARGDDNKVKRLTKEQLLEVSQKGEFSVPSARFVGRKHIWRLSLLVQKGQERTEEDHQSMLALALRQIAIDIPDRFISPRAPSVRNSLNWFFRGLYEIPAGIIGFITKKNRYESHDIISIVDKKRAEYILNSLKNLSEDVYTSEDGIMIDFRLFRRLRTPPVAEILWKIEESVSREWERDSYPLKVALIQKFSNSGIPEEEIIQRVVDAAAEEFNSRLSVALRENVELNHRDAKFGEQILDFMNVVSICEEEANIRRDQEYKFIQELESELVAKYPTFSRIPAWFAGTLEKQIQDRRKEIEQKCSLPEQILNRLISEEKIQASKGRNTDALHQYIYLLKKNLEFQADYEPKIVEDLKKELVPLVNIHRREFWDPKKWIVKQEEINGKKKFLCIKHEEYIVPTSFVGWRIGNNIVKYFVSLSNFLLVFYRNLTGPFSLRALFSRDPFFPIYKFNDDSGEISPNTDLRAETLYSRIKALWKSISDSRTDFENKPDEGFLGKSITRIFNLAWNYIFKGIFGTTILGIGFPVLAIFNSILSVSVILTSPIWVLCYTSVIDHVIFGLGRRIGFSRCPFLCLFEKIFFAGIVQAGISLGLGLVFHPIAAVFLGSMTWWRTGIRSLWDWLMVNTIIRLAGRIPAKDSFLARRIHGPGLSSLFHYEISTDLVLLALQLYLETEELTYYAAAVQEKLSEPLNIYEKLHKKLLSHFGTTISPTDKILQTIKRRNFEITAELQKKLEERKKALPVKGNVGKSKIRQTAKNHSDSIHKATILVRDFFPNHIFPYLSEENIVKFWADRNLAVDDWQGLTKQLLAANFSAEFLVPLEESDSNFTLHVEHLNTGKFVEMLFEGIPHDDLDEVVRKSTSDYSSAPKSSVKLLSCTKLEIIPFPFKNIINPILNLTDKEQNL